MLIVVVITIIIFYYYYFNISVIYLGQLCEKC